MINVVCPDCKGKLTVESPSTHSCKKCGVSFNSENEIIVFSPRDAFYEGRYTSTRNFKDMIPLPGLLKPWAYNFYVNFSMATKYEKFFVKSLKRLEKRSGKEKQKLKILDLACGGGWHFLKDYGEVYGIDLSMPSLLNAKLVYDQVYLGDIKKLPFPDETFDVVTSIDTIEHIPLEEKEKLLREIRRVLRKGGITLNYLVVEGEDSLTQFLKSHQELYKKWFIDLDGHIGLEHPMQAMNNFANAGFKVQRTKNCWAYLLFPTTYLKYLDNEYKDKSLSIKWLVPISKIVCGNFILLALCSLLLGPISSLIEKLSGKNRGLGLLIHAEKI